MSAKDEIQHCDEISNCLLNRDILDSLSEISISEKIRIAGCPPDERAGCMAERAVDSGGDRLDDEISNYLLNRDILDGLSEISISAKISIAGCPLDRRAGRMAERAADSGGDRFDDEISNHLLNRDTLDGLSEISISAKISIAGCPLDGRAGRMAERAADSGGDRFDDEISNYLLNRDILYGLSEISISAKIRIAGCLPGERADRMTGRSADSRGGRFDDEISNYLLNRDMSEAFSGISISAKIGIAGCLPDERADRNGGKTRR